MPVPPVADPPPRIDEGRHHRESNASVRLKAQRLRRALDADHLDDAIRVAADVAAELRSAPATELSPKAYYDVYLSVCAELRLLEMYVMESARRGAPVLELYERVQETPLVLPRLYLLVTAGSVYIKSLQAPAKDVLRDLVEMCTGVQHPQRGLFLRAYLAQMMKDKLPDAGVEDDGVELDVTGGTVQDSIDFVIRNFTEMNRLWVRMQHEGSPREMELREKERLELRLLVGSNIATLSRLVGSNILVYREKVLPAILDQIVNCNDAIAQEYLADCVAQVFPDEFQLATLDAFMKMCGKLVRGVNIRTILVSIIDRLTRFVNSSTQAKRDTCEAEAFLVFRDLLPDVVKGQGTSLALTDRLKIYVSLMEFVLCAETDRMDFVDNVLGFCVTDVETFVDGAHEDSDDVEARIGRGRETQKALRKLNMEDERLALEILSKPLKAFKSVGAILKLNKFVVLQQFLKYDNQKSLAARLLMSANGYEACISGVANLEKLFRYVAPLVRDGNVKSEEEQENDEEAYERFDIASITHHHRYMLSSLPLTYVSNGTMKQTRSASMEAEKIDDETFVKNQELVARIVYLCDASDTERAVQLYKALRQELLRGGPSRFPLTLPSLVFASLHLTLRSAKADKEAEEKEGRTEEMLRFAGECVSFLPNNWALLGLRLRVHVAGTAATVLSGGCIVYDNLARAFGVYENHVTGAKEQCVALQLLIGRLAACREAIDEESYSALKERAIKHAARSLSRSDQCVLLCACASLCEGEEAIKCLQRASDSAEACVDAAERVFLLLDVAGAAVTLYAAGRGEVCEEGFLHDVLGRVRTIVNGRRAKSSPVGKLAAAKFQRLVAHIRLRLHLFTSLEVSGL